MDSQPAQKETKQDDRKSVFLTGNSYRLLVQGLVTRLDAHRVPTIRTRNSPVGQLLPAVRTEHIYSSLAPLLRGTLARTIAWIRAALRQSLGAVAVPTVAVAACAIPAPHDERAQVLLDGVLLLGVDLHFLVGQCPHATSERRQAF